MDSAGIEMKRPWVGCPLGISGRLTYDRSRSTDRRLGYLIRRCPLSRPGSFRLWIGARLGSSSTRSPGLVLVPAGPCPVERPGSPLGARLPLMGGRVLLVCRGGEYGSGSSTFVPPIKRPYCVRWGQV